MIFVFYWLLYLLGLCAIIISFYQLIYNWYYQYGLHIYFILRIAKKEVFVKEAEKQCKQVDSLKIDSKQDKQLVFTTGIANTKDIIEDGSFAIKEADCIKLERKVQMLQWSQQSLSIPQTTRSQTNPNKFIQKKVKITHKNVTKYNYSLGWCSDFISSSGFKEPAGHTNDEIDWIVQKKTSWASKVFLGQYLLSDSLKNQAKQAITHKLTDQNIEQAAYSFGKRTIITIEDKYMYFRKNKGETSGDFRVWFDKIPCQKMSILSQQIGNTFQPYLCQEKYDGYKTKDQLGDKFKIDKMFEETLTQEQAINRIQIQDQESFVESCLAFWFIAGLGMFFASLIFKSDYGTVWYQFTLNLSIAAPIFLLSSGIVWSKYRPMIGMTLIILSIIIGKFVKSYFFET